MMSSRARFSPPGAIQSVKYALLDNTSDKESPFRREEECLQGTLPRRLLEAGGPADQANPALRSRRSKT